MAYKVDLTVDEKTNQLTCVYIHIRDGSSVRTEQLTSVINLDYDGDNQLLGIELIGEFNYDLMIRALMSLDLL